jgi:hypothetical protein
VYGWHFELKQICICISFKMTTPNISELVWRLENAENNHITSLVEMRTLFGLAMATEVFCVFHFIQFIIYFK